MNKKEKAQIKSMEAVCKMLDHCSIPYSGLTVYLQGVTHCEKKTAFRWRGTYISKRLPNSEIHIC